MDAQSFWQIAAAGLGMGIGRVLLDLRAKRKAKLSALKVLEQSRAHTARNLPRLNRLIREPLPESIEPLRLPGGHSSGH